MRDDLQRGQLIEDAGIDEACHARRRFVGPPEAEPDLVFRNFLTGIVREFTPAHGMNPYWKIVLDHRLKNWAELGCAQRFAGNVGEDLDAAGAELSDGSIDLGERGVDVVQDRKSVV